jgi:hypothetical protein
MRLLPCAFALFCALYLLCGTASAALIDCRALIWSIGSLGNFLNVDASNPGPDISFKNDATSGVMTQAIVRVDSRRNPRAYFYATLTGGLSPVQDSPQLAANLATNVSFSLFDIDLETNKDVIRNICGIASDGTHVAATITNLGSAVTLAGSGLNQLLIGSADSLDSGPGSSNDNARISFDSTPITDFAFTYSNTNGGPKDQEIAIDYIVLMKPKPVPEMNPAALAFMVCLLATAFARKNRPSPSVRSHP